MPHFGTVRAELHSTAATGQATRATQGNRTAKPAKPAKPLEVDQSILDRVPGYDPSNDVLVTWDDKTLPQLMQFNPPDFRGTIFQPVGFVFNSDGRSTNPNLQFPWHRPAGTDYVARFRSVRFGLFPRARRVRVFRGRIRRGRFYPVNIGGNRLSWRFPLGTTIGEVLADDRGTFAIRTRTKFARDNWVTSEEYTREPPHTMRKIGECQSCHKDAGRHVSMLVGSHVPERNRDRFGRDWYGHVRGSDGIFSFRPVSSRGQILPQFAHIAEYGEPRFDWHGEGERTVAAVAPRKVPPALMPKPEPMTVERVGNKTVIVPAVQRRPVVVAAPAVDAEVPIVVKRPPVVRQAAPVVRTVQESPPPEDDPLAASLERIRRKNIEMRRKLGLVD